MLKLRGRSHECFMGFSIFCQRDRIVMQIVVVGYRSYSEELLYVNKVLLLRVINLYTWFF